MKTILIIAATVVLTAGVVSSVGCWMSRRAASAQQSRTSVRVEAVTRGELTESVQAPGEVEPLTKVSISAKITSRIVELPHKERDRVAKGDVLVRLDARDLEAVLRSAEARYSAQKAGLKVTEAQIESTKAQIEGHRACLAEAETDLKRQLGLVEYHAVAQTAVDQAQRHAEELRATLNSALHQMAGEEANLVVLKHQLDAADADIARAREDLSYTTIASPIDGVVTVINAKVGEMVMTGTMNNAGTVILEVADLSQMLAVARVDESDIAPVQLEQKAKVHVQAYPDQIFVGTVRSVALARSANRSVSDDSRVFKTEVLIQDDGQQILSGLTADVEIQTRHHSDILKIPSQAVLGRAVDELPASIRDGNPNVDKTRAMTTVVYRDIDGKAVVTPVTVGPSDVTHTIIKAGLSEGDKVIVGPYKVLEKLAHDQQVQDEKPSTQPASTQPAAPKTLVATTQPES